MMSHTAQPQQGAPLGEQLRECYRQGLEVIQAVEEGCLGLRVRVHAADAQAECAVLSGRALPSALLDMCMSETGLANDYG